MQTTPPSSVHSTPRTSVDDVDKDLVIVDPANSAEFLADFAPKFERAKAIAYLGDLKSDADFPSEAMALYIKALFALRTHLMAARKVAQILNDSHVNEGWQKKNPNNSKSKKAHFPFQKGDPKRLTLSMHSFSFSPLQRFESKKSSTANI
jgi:hypothetical protein